MSGGELDAMQQGPEYVDDAWLDSDAEARWYDQSPTYAHLVDAWDGPTMDVAAAAEFVREHSFSTRSAGSELDWFATGHGFAIREGSVAVDRDNAVNILELLMKLGY